MSTPRIKQPYNYEHQELIEPDWRRFPGWKDVTKSEWRDVRWQRVNSVCSVGQLARVAGGLLDDTFYEDLDRDVRERATMSMLVTPQMLNTVAGQAERSSDEDLTDVFYADQVRRYMLPVFSDRHPTWPSHPRAMRDSLREKEMWTVEGLTHR